MCAWHNHPAYAERPPALRGVLPPETYRYSIVPRVTRPSVSEENVIAAVCRYYYVEPAELIGSGRPVTHTARARHVAAYLMKCAGYTTLRIGVVLARDHTTIGKSVKKIERELKHVPGMRHELYNLYAMLGGVLPSYGSA